MSRRWKGLHLGVRLLIGVFLLVGLATYCVLQIFAQEVKPGVRQGMEIALVDTANLMAELATEDLVHDRLDQGRLAQAFAAYRDRSIHAPIWGMTKHGAAFRCYVTDGTGIVRWDSEGQATGQDYSRWNDVKRTLEGGYGVRSTRVDPADPSTSSMYVAAPLQDRGRIVGVLTVVAPTASLHPYIQRSRRHILNGGAALVGASLLLGLAFTWWLVRDIDRLRGYARQVGEGARTPLPALGSPELAELGAALEHMRARLDGRAYVERYVHTLTHEMKSPLAAIRGAAELLREPLPEDAQARFTANILDQEGRLRDLVERMLALATLQHRQGLQERKPVDLEALLDRTLTSRHPRIVQAQVQIRRSGTLQGPLQGEAFLLEQALGNLLDNALAFAPAGSAIHLHLASAEGRHTLAIRDEGPGLPDYALDQVFQPFYSLPPPGSDRKGTGLGLCFVKEAATLHGGTATLGNAPEGGAVATLSLPIG